MQAAAPAAHLERRLLLAAIVRHQVLDGLGLGRQHQVLPDVVVQQRRVGDAKDDASHVQRAAPRLHDLALAVELDHGRDGLCLCQLQDHLRLALRLTACILLGLLIRQGKQQDSVMA